MNNLFIELTDNEKLMHNIFLSKENRSASDCSIGAVGCRGKNADKTQYNKVTKTDKDLSAELVG